MASDLFWPEIWGDMVKINHGEQITKREHVAIFLILNSVGKKINTVASSTFIFLGLWLRIYFTLF